MQAVKSRIVGDPKLPRLFTPPPLSYIDLDVVQFPTEIQGDAINEKNRDNIDHNWDELLFDIPKVFYDEKTNTYFSLVRHRFLGLKSRFERLGQRCLVPVYIYPADRVRTRKEKFKLIVNDVTGRWGSRGQRDPLIDHRNQVLAGNQQACTIERIHAKLGITTSQPNIPNGPAVAAAIRTEYKILRRSEQHFEDVLATARAAWPDSKDCLIGLTLTRMSALLAHYEKDGGLDLAALIVTLTEIGIDKFTQKEKRRDIFAEMIAILIINKYNSKVKKNERVLGWAEQAEANNAGKKAKSSANIRKVLRKWVEGLPVGTVVTVPSARKFIATTYGVNAEDSTISSALSTLKSLGLIERRVHKHGYIRV